MTPQPQPSYWCKRGPGAVSPPPFFPGFRMVPSALAIHGQKNLGYHFDPLMNSQTIAHPIALHEGKSVRQGWRWRRSNASSQIVFTLCQGCCGAADDPYQGHTQRASSLVPFNLTLQHSARIRLHAPYGIEVDLPKVKDTPHHSPQSCTPSRQTVNLGMPASLP